MGYERIVWMAAVWGEGKRGQVAGSTERLSWLECFSSAAKDAQRSELSYEDWIRGFAIATRPQFACGWGGGE
jgi:hypothetical protein